jgi:CO dehydrogenase/acetyl-CoA synthase beta subunit
MRLAGRRVPLFDRHIGQTDRYVDEMRAAGRQVRELPSPAWLRDPAGKPLPFRVGPGAGPGLVMKSDTFLELGSPTVGSCAFTLLTEKTALVRPGRIRLIGADVLECPPAATVPFGQVIIAAGADLREAHYPRLVESQYVGDQIEGFMVKSTPGRIWGRVSIEAAKRRFDFGFLGAALMKLIMTQVPGVTAVEVLFVTSGKSDLQPLNEIATSAGKIGHAIKVQHWRDRGIDISDCAFGGHCASCRDKAVCDEVRKLAQSRKLLVP